MTAEITVDGLFLAPRFVGCGTNRYLVNLLKHMVSSSNGSPQTRLKVLVRATADLTRNGIDGQEGPRAQICRLMRWADLWRLGLLQSVVEAGKIGTLFNPSPMPVYRKPRRLAVTVHDIVPILFLDDFTSLSGRLLRYSFQSSLKKADLILTVSEYSKNEIVSYCGAPPERIVVAYNGFDSGLFNPAIPDRVNARVTLSRNGITQPYVLHVGVIEPRKNLVRLVHAYQVLVGRRKSSELQLVLCGRLGWDYHELLNLVETREMQGRVILTGPVPDGDLAILYKNALACVMPSLYEGFGLPLLEAMACGTPVISSNSSSLPEIGGNAPVYFNPESVEEMAEVIDRVLNDSALRDSMVERGLKRAQLFSWEDCARKTLAALFEL